jgi:IstB-like ATP binding protein
MAKRADVLTATDTNASGTGTSNAVTYDLVTAARPPPNLIAAAQARRTQLYRRLRQRHPCLRARPQGVPRQPFGPLQRLPKMFADLALARGDGRYAVCSCSTDWGIEPPDAAARHDLLEVFEERYGRRSAIITSQIPVDKWHDLTTPTA